MKKFFKLSFVALLLVSVLNSCKKEYEAPPLTGDPNLVVTHTIKQLKALHQMKGVIDDINTDVVIAGVVIANDKGGNLYKQMYIQDATGALNIQLGSGSLYPNYPIGRKVFIKCKGLSITDYNGLMQLGKKTISNGSPSVDAIPSGLIANYLVGGSLNNPYIINTITDINQIKTDMQDPLVGNLIQFNNYEFLWGDLNKTFADTTSAKSAGELYIQACPSGSQSIMVRTSGYADFAAQRPPSGNGSIMAILTVYSTTPQLVLRTPDDIKFGGIRCNTPSVTAPNITIRDLKARHTISGNYDVIQDEVVIEGTVIANDISGNIYKQLFIRDSTGALQINIDNTNLSAKYPVGRNIKVLCKGLCITDVNYMTQLAVKGTVNGLVGSYPIPSAQESSFIVGGSYGNPAAPKQVTLSDLNNAGTVIATMQNPYLGDLIQLADYEFIKGDLVKSYGDSSAWKRTVNTTIKNCAGSSVIIRTSAYSNFAQNKVAQGNGTVSAVYTVFGTSATNVTKQLILREVGDVQFTNPRCNIYEEDFQTGYNKDLTVCADQQGWKSYKESGDICFVFNQLASGATFPQVSAFNSAVLSSTDIKSWLVSPAITLSAGTTPKLYYDITERYTAGNLIVKISTDYDGVSATPWSSATWTDINTITANSGTFTNKSYFYDLSANGFTAGKKIYIAFKYDVASGTSKSSVATYQPDNIKVTKN